MMTGLVLFLMLVSAKALVVLAVALGLTRLMRERSAAERHLVWMLASACVLALPVLTLAGPSWQVRMPVQLDALEPAAADAVIEHVDVRVHRHVDAAPVVTREVRRDRSRALGTPSIAPTPPAAPMTPVTPPEPPARADVIPAPVTVPVTAPASAPAAWSGPVESLRSAVPWIVLALWTAGFVFVLLRVIAGALGVARLTRSARPLLDAALLVRVHGIAAEIGVRRPLRLLEAGATSMPITFGVVRPGLLLPSSARGWTGARQEAVLRHELEHVRRWDTLSQLVAQLGCALYWFNPLMWRAARELCVEREHACDDAVLAAGSRPTDYAAELLEIARSLRPDRSVAVAAIAMARAPEVRRRVESVLDARRRRAPASTMLRIPAWIGAAMLITPLSSLIPELDARVRPAAAAANAPAAEAEAPVHAKKEHRSDKAQGDVPVSPKAWTAEPLMAGTLARGMQEDCLSGRGTRVNNSSNDRRRTIQWSGEGCSGDVLVEGDISFDPAFTTITGISRGGRLRITTMNEGTERHVTITPASGGVAYDYRVDGDRRELDAAGRQWLSSTLMLMFRRFGFMAEERATAMLRQAGADAVIAEVGVLRSDHVRSKYLTVLVEQGRLDAASLDRVLRIAGNTIDSDHYRTHIITAAASHYEFDDTVRDAYLHAVSGIDSDHYRHQALSTLLHEGRLAPVHTAAVLREAKRLDSDHYRARLLEEMAPGFGNSPAVREAWLDAARDIDSDHYKAAVIGKLLAHDLAAEELAGALAAARSIDSDHYLRRVLGEVAKRERMEPATLRALLDAADQIDSDHYRSELLIDIAKRHRMQGDARTRFEELMKDIGSGVYRGRVAEALLAQRR